MKKITTVIMSLAIVFGITVCAKADVYVHGYYRSNGSYVEPHYRSNPDNSIYNNWSTSPNINPYTGNRGTRSTQNYSSSYFSSTPRHSGNYMTRQYQSSNKRNSGYGSFFSGE